ncbi:uncharacterized protein [Rutidosis leptorrhynchoides]|uniref:uncharacterized protein n=1 Tax=Rutidosis leptorrhynchoides TaxID=125765 RepID=UPI003A997B19
MDRVLRRSSRNNQSKQKETNSSNEELINKRKQPLGDFEFDVNGSNPDLTNTIGTTFVNSSRTQFTSSVDKENMFQQSTYKQDYVDYGDLTYICSTCGAKLWLNETKCGKLTQGLTVAESLCCQKGKIALPEFTKSPPKLIWDLYTNNHPKSKHFLENIRQYNMIFAFTSMDGKVDNRFNNNRGPYTFRMCGQNFHQYGGLLPNVGYKPRFGQLYIYDTSNEANNRKEEISGKNKTKSTSSRYSLDEHLVVQIMQVLDEHYPLVKTFRMARERFKDDLDMQLKIKLIGRRTKDGRNYNLPMVDEVAALIVEDGYRTDILHRDIDVYEHTTRKKKRVTMHEFFAYKLQERAVPTLVHLGRKLYQQFVVDACTMIEAERISYIRKNQNILRADTFTNIMNASLSGNAVNSMMGNMIKLPSSFMGSARYMIENYRDAMALCLVFGYPDLFLTCICNPKWPEITRELDGTEVYTVEFQKRGLPHAHICLFLDERSKMPQPEDVDKYICAEIPDEINEPELFPKPFSGVTKTDQDGYPIYRRRNDGRTVRKQGHDLDNSCVIPYNPQLLKMYQAHLNVERCNQIGSIRYLFKYINKGNDKITSHLCDQETDEIKQYYDCRYVSSCEAMWRIFSFDIHHHRPSVRILPFHLEGEHQIILDEHEVIEQVLENPSVNTSMFLEWMKCNGCSQQARQLTYVDFPTKFIWDKDYRVWKLRKRKTGAIGRIHHVAPAAGDLFYLRILLNKVKGPTSYEEIRTVNGILFDNFKDACYHLGLLDDDNEYIEAIKEAFLGRVDILLEMFLHSYC